MWILWKVKFSKCEFSDKLRIFALVCLFVQAYLWLLWELWIGPKWQWSRSQPWWTCCPSPKSRAWWRTKMTSMEAPQIPCFSFRLWLQGKQWKPRRVHFAPHLGLLPRVNLPCNPRWRRPRSQRKQRSSSCQKQWWKHLCDNYCWTCCNWPGWLRLQRQGPMSRKFDWLLIAKPTHRILVKL